MAAFIVRRLGAPDAASYRALRLDGLLAHPEAFSASWEDEISRPLTWFADRIESNVVFGGFSSSRRDLAGVAGLLVPEATKVRHKGVLWGMFVRPEARKSGMGAGLVASVVEHAAQIVEELQLTVVASNTAAVSLYTRAGFKPYGLAKRALKVGDLYYDELLMTLPLNRPG